MRQLRWRLNIGMHPPEPGGQWTASEATFVVAAAAPRVTVRWHAGDEKAPGYRAEVSFYVDGILVERSLAGAGRIRESVLPLPPVAGFKRLSVRISPPFVPAAALGGDDRRTLEASQRLFPESRPRRAPRRTRPPASSPPSTASSTFSSATSAPASPS